MALSENMTQKSDYQLNWILANEPTYSENQIKAAFDELKRREKIKSQAEDIKNNIKKLWDSIYRFFK